MQPVCKRSDDIVRVAPDSMNIKKPSFFFDAFRVWIVCLAVIGVPIAGCAVRLAPLYDRTIIEGLTKSNEDAMTLFASVSSGAGASTFGKRKATYDGLIGKLDALRLQTKARPTPRPLIAQVLAIGPRTSTEPKDLELLEAPTPAILGTLVSTVTMMRDRDQRFGLTSFLVIGFKQSFEISMDQALTYEKALER